MRTSHRRLLVGLAVLLLAGCSVTVHPHFGPGMWDPAASLDPVPGVDPRGFPFPDATPDPADAGVVRRICRTSGVPRGWIAIRYVADLDDCPTAPDSPNRYTAAVIQRFSVMPVGTVLTVCADQGIPAGWIRNRQPETTDGCPGARVREGTATTRAIHRVR